MTFAVINQQVLLDAMFNQEFEVHYQVQKDISSGRYLSIEALARWNKNGNIYQPSAFLSSLKKWGLMPSFGIYLFERVCHDILELNRQGITFSKVSVNFSYQQLIELNIVSHISAFLQHYALSGHQFCVEITETEAIAESSLVVTVLQQLQQFGVSIALDDFCTGYSSLSHLTTLPVNEIKLDKKFVCNICKKGVEAQVCQSIIALAKALGVTSIAEGVETLTQEKMLVEMGITATQGFYYSRPLSVNALVALMNQHKCQLRLIS